MHSLKTNSGESFLACMSINIRFSAHSQENKPNDHLFILVLSFINVVTRLNEKMENWLYMQVVENADFIKLIV